MTHLLQRDLGLVDQSIILSFKQRMTLLLHCEHNICRDAVGFQLYSQKIKKHVKRI